MKYVCKKARLWVFKAVLILITVCCLAATLWQPRTVSVSAASNDRIKIQSYDIQMDIGKDRQVRVKERITVQFLRSGLSMFYRSLPMEQARYYDISAKCLGNPNTNEPNDEFYYEVANNPDVSGFFDINCIGGAQVGNVWTYEIGFTMENASSSVNTSKGMTIDVVPFGFTVPLHNVTGRVTFPYAVQTENLKTFVGFGKDEDMNLGTLSVDGKTLTFACEKLSMRYNDRYEEYVADGVTVSFIMDGQFDNYHAKRIFTDGMLGIFLGGNVAVVLAVLAYIFLRKPREIVTVVNLTAPDGMDPMKMGKLLDGNTDEEDITSMIFYFAHKGWLFIDMQDDKDPVFIKRCNIPTCVSPHARTIFNGLFASGDRVRVSDLKEKFYKHADMARMQVTTPKMYEKRSVFAYLVGGILAVAYMFLTVLVLGKVRLGASYISIVSLLWAIPVGVTLLIGFLLENYRYKWKTRTRRGLRVVQMLVMFIGIIVYTGLCDLHITTEYERFVMCVFAAVLPFITQNAMCRTQEYCEVLGQILGFKDFIVTTEEEKIKFMLEDNPTLYYKVLPYAQVLGVTDEWEGKFKDILIEAPEWCNTGNVTAFDYIAIRGCLRGAMRSAMSRPDGGGSVGRSGGGGSFGGFGGGGFGGGGGGAR